MTLPRLELNAAALLAEIYSEVIKSIKIKIDKTFFWTDSAIAICWIQTPANKFKTFVSTRANNPADALSRGQTPIEFLKNNSWIYGPKWLSQPETSWPKSCLKPIKKLPEE